MLGDFETALLKPSHQLVRRSVIRNMHIPPNRAAIPNVAVISVVLFDNLYAQSGKGVNELLLLCTAITVN